MAPEGAAADDGRLVLEGVGKRYPGAETLALTEIDLAIREGEVLALVGESGSGKSTLLRLCNRLERPTTGRVLLDGRDLAGEDPVELRRRIGYVQQEGGLLPHWTVWRNVELVPRLLGWPAAERRRRGEAVLRRVGLDPAEHGPRYPAQLSGGQQQRVAVARALAARPSLVLLDEPFGALDAVTRARLQRELARLRDGAEPFTALLVTHDLDEAFLLGDRVAVLREGSIVQLGTPEELAARPAHPYVGELLDLGRRRGGPAGGALGAAP